MENRKNYSEVKKGIEIFKWTISKQKSYLIAYTILLFMAVPLVQIITMLVMNGDKAYYGDFHNDYVEAMSNMQLLLVGYLYIGLGILYSLIMGIASFSYLHNKRSVDLFGSMPVRRSTMFLARYIAAVVSSIIPFVIIGLIGGGLMLDLTLFRANLWYIAIGVLGVITNISFVGMISLCCGTVAHVIISYVVINLIFPVIVYIVTYYPTQIIPGAVFGEVPATAYTLLSPGLAGWVAVTEAELAETATGLILYFVWNICFTIVLALICIVLSKRRKAEVAQNAFAFSLVERIIKMLAGFAVSFGVAWVLAILKYGNSYTGVDNNGNLWIWFIVGAIIGNVAVTIILHLIYNRSFAKAKVMFMEMAGIFVLVMSYTLIITSGCFGYADRVPKVSDIEYVVIESEDNDEFIVRDENLIVGKFYEKEYIEAVVDYHKEFIKGNENFKKSGLFSVIGNRYDWLYVNRGFYYGVRIDYKLKNDSVFSRYYDDSYQTTIDMPFILESAMDSKTLALTGIPAKQLALITVFDVTEEDKYINKFDNFTVEQKEKLKKALREDIHQKAMSGEEELDKEEAKLRVELFFNGAESVYSIEGYNDTSIEYNYYIDESYENTMKALKEIGAI